MHLLLRHPGLCVPANRGEHGGAAANCGGYDPLHGQSKLLPPRPGAGISGLEEGHLCWRGCHGFLFLLPPCLCLLPTLVSVLHFVSNIPLELQGVDVDGVCEHVPVSH